MRLLHVEDKQHLHQIVAQRLFNALIGNIRVRVIRIEEGHCLFVSIYLAVSN